jgi:16S rRNA (guanine527-N7)-methyltransferase
MDKNGRRYSEWRERLAIDDEAWNRIGQYVAALESARWNVTGFYGQALWERGILDSLAVLSVADDWQFAMDIGSGSGLPGLVLACARPARTVVLVESRQRRAQYLETLIARLKLSQTRVIHARAEVVLAPAQAEREAFDLVTLRAVGGFRLSVELGLAAARIDGDVVLLRGQSAPEECRDEKAFLEELGGVVMAVESVPLPSEPEGFGYVIRIHKQTATPDRYPRERHLGE